MIGAMRNVLGFVAASLLALAALPAQGAEYPLPKDHDVIGEVREVIARHEDTFVSLARRHGVGLEELKLANPGVDMWLPGEGTKVTLPTQFVLPRAPRTGIVINIAELRLYYFPKDEPEKVYTYPISIGRMDWRTPVGTTSITAKAKNPSWYPPQSIRDEHAARGDILPAVVPPGPDNPLGNHSLRLGLPGYLIHGTNMPSGVGMRVTHGCIRMFPEDIEAMFERVPTGTPVHIVNQPYKLGWNAAGELMLEVHPPIEEELGEGMWTLTDLTREVVAVTDAGFTSLIDWDRAEHLISSGHSLGLPVTVSTGARVQLADEEGGESSEDNAAPADDRSI